MRNSFNVKVARKARKATLELGARNTAELALRRTQSYCHCGTPLTEYGFCVNCKKTRE